MNEEKWPSSLPIIMDYVDEDTKKLWDRIAELERLLTEAHTRFCNYEMDSEGEAPASHREFMIKLAGALNK